jgi:hypothetical protein
MAAYLERRFDVDVKKLEAEMEEHKGRLDLIIGRGNPDPYDRLSLYDRRALIVINRSSAHRANRYRDYHAQLRIKYDYAADHPWLPVSPDPPRPE